MSRLRVFFFVSLLLLGAILSVLLVRAEINTPFAATLAPAFQLLGRPVKSVDRALTRVLPVDEVDEAAYGDAIARRYEPYNAGTPEQQTYVQRLIVEAGRSGHKGFAYRAFLIDTVEANAFALPGGVVVVTTGLLSTVRSEAELMAVLAHEVGHVELSHCLDGVRFEVAARKVGAAPLGELADLAMTVMMRHSFSKTQEEEADEYAWAYLLQSRYTPAGEGRAFQALRQKYGASDRAAGAHPVVEYIQSHPYLELREERYLERAKAWRLTHSGEPRYDGRRNLEDHRCMLDDGGIYEEEWSPE